MTNYVLLLISVALIVLTMRTAYNGSNKRLAATSGSCMLWFLLLVIL